MILIAFKAMQKRVPHKRERCGIGVWQGFGLC